MSDLLSSLNRLKKFRAATETTDPTLAQESLDSSAVVQEARFSSTSVEAQIEEESIIQRRNRPALRIIKDTAELAFQDSVESAIWQSRLETAKPLLDKAIKAVGRIDLINSPDYSWVGTGWLLDEDIIVTNRHVAVLFVSQASGKFQFRQSGSEEVIPAVDFVREFSSTRQNTFELIEPLYLVPEPGPDMALFRVSQTGSDGNLPSSIALAANPAATVQAATIGYPANDGRIPDADLMRQIYGHDYDKKRLAPGAVKTVNTKELTHDCTTLGGNSGSVIIDMNRSDEDTPVAVGLHFAGAFLKDNYAVPSDLVASVLHSVKRGKKPYAREAQPASSTAVNAVTSCQPVPNTSADPGVVTISVPLNISVSLGQAVTPTNASATTTQSSTNTPGVSTLLRPPPLDDTDDEDEDEDDIEDDAIDLVTEALPEDYAKRSGYIENFIGNGELNIPLPQVKNTIDVLSYNFMGETKQALTYQHFSVVMKASRRLLYFSAVNLDGTRTIRTKRPKWRLDPRIPKHSQIIKECYGRPPKFSRGHMTRKTDASWGDSQEIAVRGVTDTMHVTNAAPQMQAFNSPIWLELEDYALDNAVEDGMRICVFTGPYFSGDDPLYHGVQVPVAFWKVLAFRHDKTGQLSATGYELDQTLSLPVRSQTVDNEFVFGAFTSTRLNVAAQVSVSHIEQKAGIDFGPLRNADPLASSNESAAIQAKLLERLSQVQFI